MNILQRAAMRIVKNMFDEEKRAFFAGDPLPGDISVTTETALKYSAVFACVRVLSETFASAPFMLYRKNGDEREPVTDHPLYDILHNRPNEEMAPFAFKESSMMSICLGGNAVAEKLRGSKGNLVGIYPYPHSMVVIERDPQTRRLAYRIRDGDRERALTRDQVLHIPGVSLDGVVGLSPISYAAAAIRLGLTYEEFGNRLFKNSAMPSGAFRKQGVLREEAYTRLKEQLAEKYAGLRNAGTPMLLEDDLDYKQFSINPVDAQLLESKYFQIEDICRIYRVPQHLVNKLDRSTNNNIEHQSLEFVMYTMLPYYKRVEECINAQLLSAEDRGKGIYGEFKIDGLLRGDNAARAALYANGRQWGWLSANDIRRLENMPPIEGGDRYLEPTNMTEAGSNQGETVNAKVLDEIQRLLDERR